MELSNKITILMIERDIKNPKELSENLKKQKLDIPYTTLLTIINGEVKDIKLNTAKKLSAYFNVSLDELLDDKIVLKENSTYDMNEFKSAIKTKKSNTIEIDVTDLTDDDIEDIKELARSKRERRKKN